MHIKKIEFIAYNLTFVITPCQYVISNITATQISTDYAKISRRAILYVQYYLFL